MTLGASLKGKSALVTGASGGIGIGIVDSLLRHGVQVAAADKAAMSGRLESLKSRYPSDLIVLTADLSSMDGVRGVVDEVVGTFGSIGILVNNAGGGIILPFLEHTLESMRETIDRNLWTTVLCCHAVLPHMRSARYGRIVSIGAESVRNGLYDHAMYNAAKGGVHALTTGLAREFASSGITVNVVAPAGVRTEAVAARTGSAWEQWRDQVLATIPLGRLAEVSEVAAAVTFLVSDDASYITGQTLSVNGGSSML